MNRLVTEMTKARDYISDPTHWMKGALSNGKGKYCSIGVITNYTGNTAGTMNSLIAYLKVAIAELKKEGKLGRFIGGDVVDFNDARGTKHDHVVMVFNRATELVTADLKKEQEEAEPVAPVEEGVYIKMPTKVLEKVG